jgi:hypothetical protein
MRPTSTSASCTTAPARGCNRGAIPGLDGARLLFRHLHPAADLRMDLCRRTRAAVEGWIDRD